MRSLGVQTGRRCFATGNRLEASYGFIGLGRMGEFPFGLLEACMEVLLLTRYFRLPNGQEPSRED